MNEWRWIVVACYWSFVYYFLSCFLNCKSYTASRDLLRKSHSTTPLFLRSTITMDWNNKGMKMTWEVKNKTANVAILLNICCWLVVYFFNFNSLIHIWYIVVALLWSFALKKKSLYIKYKLLCICHEQKNLAICCYIAIHNSHRERITKNTPRCIAQMRSEKKIRKKYYSHSLNF